MPDKEFFDNLWMEELDVWEEEEEFLIERLNEELSDEDKESYLECVEEDLNILKEDCNLDNSLKQQQLEPGIIIAKKETYVNLVTKVRPYIILSYEHIENPTYDYFCDAKGLPLFTDWKVEEFKKKRIDLNLFNQNAVDEKIKKINDDYNNFKVCEVSDINVLIEAYITGKLLGVNQELNKKKGCIVAESFNHLIYSKSDSNKGVVGISPNYCSYTNRIIQTTKGIILSLSKDTINKKFANKKYCIISPANIRNIKVKSEVSLNKSSNIIYDIISRNDLQNIISLCDQEGIETNYCKLDELAKIVFKSYIDLKYEGITKTEMKKFGIIPKDELILRTCKTSFPLDLLMHSLEYGFPFFELSTNKALDLAQFTKFIMRIM